MQRIGDSCAHAAVVDGTAALRLASRFPESWGLWIFFARASVTYARYPLRVSEIQQRLDRFGLVWTAPFVRDLRARSGALSAGEAEFRPREVELRGLFRKLLEDLCAIYGVIVDDMPALLPRMLEGHSEHFRVVRERLFAFTQDFPGTVEADFFLNLYEAVCPGHRSAKAMRKLCAAPVPPIGFRDQLHARVARPEAFIRESTETRPPALPVPTIPEDLAHFALRATVRGPYERQAKHPVRLFLQLAPVIATIVITVVIISARSANVSQIRQQLEIRRLIGDFQYEHGVMYAFLHWSGGRWPWGAEGNRTREAMRGWFFKNVVDTMRRLRDVVQGTGPADAFGISVNEFAMELNVTDGTKREARMNIYQLLLGCCVMLLDFSSDERILGQSGAITPAQYLEELSSRIATAGENFETKLAAPDDVPKLRVALLVITLGSCALIALSALQMMTAARRTFEAFFETLKDIAKSPVISLRRYANSCIKEVGGLPTRAVELREPLMERSAVLWALVTVVLLVIIGLSVGMFVVDSCLAKQFETLAAEERWEQQSFRRISVGMQLAFAAVADQGPPELREVKQDGVMERLSELVREALREWWVGSVKRWGCALCSAAEASNRMVPGTPTTAQTIITTWIAQLSAFTELTEPGELGSALENLAINFNDTVRPAFEVLSQSLNETGQGGMEHSRVVFSWLTALLFLAYFVVFGIGYLAARGADRPFREIILLLSRVMHALSPEGRALLTGEEAKVREETALDSKLYDTVIDRANDSVLIIDRQLTIKRQNQAASRVLTEGENMKLVARLIQLRVEDSGDSLDLAITDHVSRATLDASTIPVEGANCNYLVTLLPIAGPQSKRAEQWALIFRDVGEERRQQRLVRTEAERHMEILYQVLPQQVGERLLSGETGISFVVEIAAVAFCDICSFTPWCAQNSDRPERVVNALNAMFSSFDRKRTEYSAVTKLKCIGDCYVSAAGVFSDNRISAQVCANQMACFCLDCVDALAEVNSQGKTSLRVRCGAAQGGPVTCGVMGMRKPTFDVWGGIVNEAEQLEVTGHPMEIHVNSQLRSYIVDTAILVTPEGDMTFHVTRAHPAVCELSESPTSGELPAEAPATRVRVELDAE
jgi:class 3 adenylate cyclase